MGISYADRIKRRQTNFEILRIVCMLVIVWNHFFTEPAWSGTNLYIAHLFSFGKAGVDLFVMVTGWFLIKSKFKVESILKLLGKALFYGLVFGIVSTCASGGKLHSADYSLHWFIISYFILYLLFPFLNKIAHGVTKNQYRFLLIVLLFSFSILPVLVAVLPKGLGDQLKFMSLGYQMSPAFFCALYLFSGYLRIYGIPKINYKCLSVVSFSVLLLVRALWCLEAAGCVALPKAVTSLLSYDHDGCSLVMVLLAFSVFCLFASMRVASNMTINRIAAYTLGVLLISDNPVVRTWLWAKCIPMDTLNPIAFFFGSFLVACIIFIVCTVVDMMRSKVARSFPYTERLKNQFRSIDAVLNGDSEL